MSKSKEKQEPVAGEKYAKCALNSSTTQKFITGTKTCPSKNEDQSCSSHVYLHITNVTCALMLPHFSEILILILFTE